MRKIGETEITTGKETITEVAGAEDSAEGAAADAARLAVVSDTDTISSIPIIRRISRRYKYTILNLT